MKQLLVSSQPGIAEPGEFVTVASANACGIAKNPISSVLPTVISEEEIEKFAAMSDGNYINSSDMKEIDELYNSWWKESPYELKATVQQNIMNDKLKPNQEKRIIENCVESVIDDLDYYHFDEKLMKQYEKELLQFFTKISKEYSIFKTGFDFSNKKNIVTDKEKLVAIKKVLDDTPARQQSFKFTAWDFEKALEEIKKILEK